MKLGLEQRIQAATHGLLGNECAAVCLVGLGEAQGREAWREVAGTDQGDSGEVGRRVRMERERKDGTTARMCGLSLSHGEDTSREPERKGSLEGWEGWQAW